MTKCEHDFETTREQKAEEGKLLAGGWLSIEEKKCKKCGVTSIGYGCNG